MKLSLQVTLSLLEMNEKNAADIFVSKGTIFIGDNRNGFFKFDLKTGKQKGRLKSIKKGDKNFQQVDSPGVVQRLVSTIKNAAPLAQATA